MRRCADESGGANVPHSAQKGGKWPKNFPKGMSGDMSKEKCQTPALFEDSNFI